MVPSTPESPALAHNKSPSMASERTPGGRVMYETSTSSSIGDAICGGGGGGGGSWTTSSSYRSIGMTGGGSGISATSSSSSNIGMRGCGE